MNRVLNTFDSQVELMKELKEVDVAQLAKLNVNVLQELRTSTKEFEKFNLFLNQLNVFVDNAQKLNYNINSQLDRTYSIEKIAETIGSNIEVNRNMIGVLQSELNEMSQRKQFVQDAVIDVDDSIKRMLGDLRGHIETQIQAIKEITIKEEDLLEKLLKEDRGNLNELKKLGDLKSSMSLIQQESRNQNDKLDKLIDLLSKNRKEKNPPFSELFSSDKILKTLGYLFGGIVVLVWVVFLLVKLLNYFFD